MRFAGVIIQSAFCMIRYGNIRACVFGERLPDTGIVLEPKVRERGQLVIDGGITKHPQRFPMLQLFNSSRRNGCIVTAYGNIQHSVYVGPGYF
ncbi:hypothetical protein D3C87_1904240 [compost metagenome]